jgi:hypothetical protein
MYAISIFATKNKKPILARSVFILTLPIFVIMVWQLPWGAIDVWQIIITLLYSLSIPVMYDYIK